MECSHFREKRKRERSAAVLKNDSEFSLSRTLFPLSSGQNFCHCKLEAWISKRKKRVSDECPDGGALFYQGKTENINNNNNMQGEVSLHTEKRQRE